MKKVRQNIKITFVALLMAGILFLSMFGLKMEVLASVLPQNDSQGKQKVVLAAGTQYATDMYIIKSGKPGPVAMFVGGMHGDGIAGVKAAMELTDILPEKGTLLVLPEANKLAVNLNKRMVPGGDDLNRVFPKTSQEVPGNALAKAIYNAVKQYNVNWLIDLHEGNEFSTVGTGNSGQSLIFHPDTNVSSLANKIVNTLNNDISNSKEQFSLLRYPAKGSLARSTAEFLGVNSFIFETCNKQNLLLRVDYHVKAAGILLQDIGMINVPATVNVSNNCKKIVLAPGTVDTTDLYVINSGKPGPVMMVVGGMHGDGTAGYKAARQMINYSIEKGVLLVLPEANKRAVALNQRMVPGGLDLNRIFPQTDSEIPGNTLAREIQNTLLKYKVTWIIDLHEGNTFSKVQSGSTGQSLIYFPTASTTPVVEKLIASINKDITKTTEQFSLLKNPAKGSLARSANELSGINSFIFETCNKQAESVRIGNHIKAVELLMTELGLKRPPVQQTREKVVLASGTKYATDLYIINSGKPGPVVMIVGGIHGNETAGVQAAAKVKDYSIKNGTLLVLPEANKRAVDINKRLVTGEGDFNRAFPTTAKEQPANVLSKAVYDTVKKYNVEWLMDMHEGFDYYTNSATDSVGQTLIHYPAGEMPKMASKIISAVNAGSSTKEKFTLLKYPVKGSLARSTGELLGVNSFILESCMKQSLSVRVDNQLTAAGVLLKELNMQ
jgi:predicted deacylase